MPLGVVNSTNFVPDMEYHSEVSPFRHNILDLGASATLDVNGVIAAGDGTATGDTNDGTAVFAAAYDHDNMATYGRNVTVDGDGAGMISVVTITGRDYLGQLMVEAITANGTTAVAGKKAFRYIDRVEWTLTADNVDVGWGDILGLPFKSTGLITASEFLDGVVDTGGTFVAGSDATQSATSAEPRGTFLPSTATNGTRIHSLGVLLDHANLHGIAHYGG